MILRKKFIEKKIFGKKKNRKIIFPYDSGHCASFGTIKMSTIFGREGEVYISLSRTVPYVTYHEPGN